jgi:hypothetical protein
MEELRFVSLFEDFQTQSGRMFIDELETAFEIGGIVEDKLKKVLFKMKLSGLCRQWYYNEYDHYDHEEYKKLRWGDVKKRFLSTSNLFSNDYQRDESYNGIKECFIEENSQANECEVNQRNDHCCIIENNEVNEGVVEEFNGCFIENSKRSDMYVEKVEDNQMIEEDNLFRNDDGEISVEDNYVEKDLWKWNPKEILSYKEEKIAANDDKCLESIKTNEANYICCVKNEEKIQHFEYNSEVHVKGTPNENNGLTIMSFGYEFNNERQKFIHILKMKGTKWKLFYFYLILIFKHYQKDFNTQLLELMLLQLCYNVSTYKAEYFSEFVLVCRH